MKRNDEESFVLYVLVVCVFALAACVLGAWLSGLRAHAQESPAAVVQLAAVEATHTVSGAEKIDGGAGSLETLLVRVAVGEADWSATDAAAIWHVLKWRAIRNRMPIETMVRRYSAVFKGSPSLRIKWVMELEPTCAEPAHWPSNAAWSNYRDKCHRTFGYARAFLMDRLADPCPDADHFGGMRNRADSERATRAVQAGRWRVVQCDSPTVNTFFAERWTR